MQDCPARWADHPSTTPAFHQVVRRCNGCARQGCVVPRCRRNQFVPAARQVDWRTTPAGARDRAAWRCVSCRKADAPVA